MLGGSIPGGAYAAKAGGCCCGRMPGGGMLGGITPGGAGAGMPGGDMRGSGMPEGIMAMLWTWTALACLAATAAVVAAALAAAACSARVGAPAWPLRASTNANGVRKPLRSSLDRRRRGFVEKSPLIPLAMLRSSAFSAAIRRAASLAATSSASLAALAVAALAACLLAALTAAACFDAASLASFFAWLT